jgi:hypothetical protein
MASGYKAAYLLTSDDHIFIENEWHQVIKVGSADLIELPEGANIQEYVEAKAPKIKIWVKPYYAEKYIIADRMQGFKVLEGPLLKPQPPGLIIEQQLKLWYWKSKT